MTLKYPLSRRAMAFRWSVDTLFQFNPKIYLWTFTWKVPHSDKFYGESWKGFSRSIQNTWPLLKGMRVFEMHPGSWRTFGESHGVHVHALFNDRINIHRLQKIGERYGIGRIHVRRCNHEEAMYLAKYLTKKAERELPKGMRAFGTVGQMKCNKIFTSVRDVRIHTEFHENVATWQHRLRVKRMTPDFIHTIYMNSKLFGPVENWPLKRLSFWGEKARAVICPQTMAKAKAKGMERIAQEWKWRSYAIKEKSGAIRPPKAKNFLENSPRVSPGATGEDTRLDIGAHYWDKFPLKTDGTRLAYYRVCK